MGKAERHFIADLFFTKGGWFYLEPPVFFCLVPLVAGDRHLRESSPGLGTRYSRVGEQVAADTAGPVVHILRVRAPQPRGDFP